MKLQTIILGLCTISTLATAGFFDNDKAYYDKHPKEAEAKFKECEKNMAHAMIDQDKEQYQEIVNDAECIASKKSYKEYKQKIYKAKYEAEQKKRAEEKAEKEAQFKIDYKKQLTLQQEMPYEEFVKIYNSCRLTFGAPTAECKVYDELKHVRKEKKIKELLTQYQGDALRAYKKEVCDKQGSSGIDCDIAYLAAKKNENDTITRLTSNKEAFKKVYNECSSKIQPLQKNINKLDKQLDTLHKQQSEMEELLADPDIYNEQNKNKLSTLLADKGNVDKQIESIEDEWMELSEQFEILKKP